jgi:hypothetical protein
MVAVDRRKGGFQNRKAMGNKKLRTRPKVASGAIMKRYITEPELRGIISNNNTVNWKTGLVRGYRRKELSSGEQLLLGIIGLGCLGGAFLVPAFLFFMVIVLVPVGLRYLFISSRDSSEESKQERAAGDFVHQLRSGVNESLAVSKIASMQKCSADEAKRRIGYGLYALLEKYREIPQSFPNKSISY